MAKFTDDSVLNAACAKVATATRQSITSGQPANFAGIAAVSLGNIVMTAGDGNGDYAIADGTTSGRKVTVAAQSGTASASGNATHVCLDDGTTLLHVTTVTTQAITSGNAYNLGAYAVEFADVTP